MKRIIQFLKSPRSDCFLFVLLLVFANLVAGNAFFRIDLTQSKSYSLSEESRRLVRTLEQPLSVKVFFSDNLNAPYSNVAQYAKDLLVEYKGCANRNFSYEFMDMGNPENENLARSYGLRQLQIQEIKNNEVGFKQVWLGMVFLYADRIEILDGIRTTDALEYNITMTAEKMISTTGALAGLSGKARLTLYVTDELADFGIAGFADMEEKIRSAYYEVNKKNNDRIEFVRVEPPQDEIPALVERYGIQSLSWNDGNGREGRGALGLVLEYGDTFSVMPLMMSRFFGNNFISGLDTLEDALAEGLQKVVSKTSAIGYVTGHGELDFADSERGAGRLNTLVSDRYTFETLNLAEDDIPFGMASIVINGPKDAFSDAELYKIDQFIMKGGNLILFADPFDEIVPEQASFYQQPQFVPLQTGIEKILEKYGIVLEKNYVYDTECYTEYNQRYGKIPFYFAPMLQKKSLDAKNPITKNLGYVLFLQSGAIDVSRAEENKNLRTTVLGRTSEHSWTVDKNITVNPTLISVPGDTSELKSENIAVLLEGTFSSAFDGAVSDDSAETEVLNGISFSAHIPQSVQNGKILVVSTSKVTGPQISDENGPQPISLFLRNAVDYMNGEEDVCVMRTKGLSLNTLSVKNQSAALFTKYFNEAGLAILVAVIGIVVFFRIKAKKNRIRNRYNPNDSRIVNSNEKVQK